MINCDRQDLAKAAQKDLRINLKFYLSLSLSFLLKQFKFKLSKCQKLEVRSLELIVENVENENNICIFIYFFCKFVAIKNINAFL